MPSPTFCSNCTCSFKSSDPCLIGQATRYNLCLPADHSSPCAEEVVSALVHAHGPFSCSPAHLNISLPRLIYSVPCTRLLHQTLEGSTWFSLLSTLVYTLPTAAAPAFAACGHAWHLTLSPSHQRPASSSRTEYSSMKACVYGVEPLAKTCGTQNTPIRDLEVLQTSDFCVPTSTVIRGRSEM